MPKKTIPCAVASCDQPANPANRRVSANPTAFYYYCDTHADRATVPGAYGIKQMSPDTPRALTCGTCGRTWSEDITPAARCPWEYEHDERPHQAEKRRVYRITRTETTWIEVEATSDDAAMERAYDIDGDEWDGPEVDYSAELWP